MKTKIGWIILATALSGTVFAGSEFSLNLDVDESGTITKEEASANAVVTEMFDEIDLNSDGEIDATEFARFEEVPQEGGDTTEK